MSSSKAPAGSKSQLILHFYDPDIQAKDALGRTLDEILSWDDIKLERYHNYIQMLFPLPEGSPYNSQAPIIDLHVMQAFRARSELRQQLRRSFERMLAFYGFEESTKSEDDLEQEKLEKEAAELTAKSTNGPDPLLESASDALLQKTVDTGHRTEATQAAAKIEKVDTYADAPIDADTTSPEQKANQSSNCSSTAPTNMSAANPLPYHIIRAPKWRPAFRNWASNFDHNHLRITRILRCLRVLGLQAECTAFFKALERVFNDPAIKISDRSMGYWKLAVTRRLYRAPDDSKCRWLEGWEKEQAGLRKAAEENAKTGSEELKKKKSVSFDEDMQDQEAE
ncbi:hypothetical protein BDW02DRAFT_265561 [Decorospora gaudefroyi]|uniref:Opioid growth factor receptor (OGFr) conserved domain-containing protein n=1 Tax=Decorospora gaudefroyi TaxID=184978 RepID=A0A6A5KI68_9PLEO|nr:hypothetical protein BDW02DRAFT_265561 [Decorospora gaudefroyi]